MPFTTYAELQTTIATWLNRDDLASNAVDFISLGEAQLERDVQHWKGEARAATTFDGRFTDVPSDLIETLRITIDTEKRPLQLITAYDMQLLRAGGNDTPGIPHSYAMIGDKYELYPTPNDTFTGSVYYRQSLPRLSDSTTSNWLLETAPDAYLYAALLASAPFLRDDERLRTWSGLYLEAIQKLNRQSERATHGGSLRMRIGAPGHRTGER